MERIRAIGGGFCAAFLVYLVAGEAAAIALAAPFDARVPPTCWPMASLSLAWVECESAVAQAVWFGAIGIPNLAMLGPASAIEAAVSYFSPDSFGAIYRVVDMRQSVVGAAIITAVAAAGARHIAVRAPVIAWLLAFAFVAEAGYMASVSMSAPVKFELLRNDG